MKGIKGVAVMILLAAILLGLPFKLMAAELKIGVMRHFSAAALIVVWDSWLTLCKAMQKTGTTTDVYKIRQALSEAIATIPIQAYGEYKGFTPGGQAWGYNNVITEIGQDGVPFLRSLLPITYENASVGEPKM